jgi:hypothetical protein
MHIQWNYDIRHVSADQWHALSIKTVAKQEMSTSEVLSTCYIWDQNNLQLQIIEGKITNVHDKHGLYGGNNSCDLTPKSWNSPLLDIGLLKCMTAVMNMLAEIRALPQN